jgi:hypothetical protein
MRIYQTNKLKGIDMNYFKIVSIATSAIFFYLFFQLLLNSNSFVNDLGLQSCETATILARRASIFMLGISILSFSSKNLPHSKARQFICLSIGITMLGLACTGSYELIMRTVNSSMFQAIIIEIVLGFSFLTILFMNSKIKTTE